MFSDCLISTVNVLHVVGDTMVLADDTGDVSSCSSDFFFFFRLFNTVRIWFS